MQIGKSGTIVVPVQADTSSSTAINEEDIKQETQ
jgi:hypothetical protein